MTKLRSPIPSSIIKTRVQQLQKRLRRKVNESTDENTLLADAYSELKDFFIGLREKSMSPLILSEDKTRDSVQYNRTMEDIQDDLENILTDSKQVADSIVATTNFSLTNQRNLLGKVERLTSTSVDLRLVNDQPDVSVLVAGDDFIDDSRVDGSFPVPGIRTGPRPLQNAVTLAPTSAVNVLSDGKAKVIRVEGPAKTSTSSGLYEGKFYNWLGEAIPEGGVGFQWIKFAAVKASHATARRKQIALVQKWNNFVSKQFGVEPDRDDELKFSSAPVDMRRLLLELRDDPAYQTGAKTYGVGFGFTVSELEMILGNYQDEIGSDYIVLPYESFQEGELPNSVGVFYRPALIPLSLMIIWRARGIDGDPATIMRFENNFQVASGFGLSPTWPPQDWTEFEKLLRSMLGSQQLTEHLDKYAAISDESLTVRITIELEDILPVNWVHLIPIVEASGAWLRVEDIEFSVTDAEDGYKQLPGMQSNRYDNILTDEANREISEDEAFVTLSPDRGQYTGSGLWIFPTRETKFLRITLRQDVLTAAAYEVLVLHIQNTFTIHKVVEKSGFLGLSSSTRRSTETRVVDETIPLDYERSLIFSHTESDELRDDVSGETDAPLNIEFDNQTANFLGFTTPFRTGTVLGDILGFIFGSTTVTTTVSETGWKILDSWKEARFDQARYSIGIRDIGMFAYSYESESSFVSKPFRTPLPIDKVVLFTDEFVPEEFREEDPSKLWTSYEISFDDQVWFPIAPVANQVSVNADGQPTAQIYNVNSSVPQRFRNPRAAFVDFTEQVNQVRLRVTMRRPDGLTTFSPVLKRYRLRLSLKGGLF